MYDCEDLKYDFTKFIILLLIAFAFIGFGFMAKMGINYSNNRPLMYGFLTEVTEKYDKEKYIEDFNKNMQGVEIQPKQSNKEIITNKDNKIEEHKEQSNSNIKPLYDKEGNIIGYLKE
ncbi:MAG: hypothetical protein E7H54_05780 [Clostridium perfringens]|uniref:hypothetical protein n=1 Tax=Clostridium perfringens TaxID=1502 RepID=UPI0024BD1C88|nr:hypothetical protein [Clostridium perfringens]MDU8988675.1 hypothetical protein [Clostridium perfringens]